jgi:hypothetical protein
MTAPASRLHWPAGKLPRSSRMKKKSGFDLPLFSLGVVSVRELAI